MIITPYVTVQRPGDTTQYGVGDLIANDVDAADVVALRFGVGKLGHGTGKVMGGRMYKNDVTPTVASFALHLFAAAPVPSVGDNAQLNNSGVFAVSSMEHYIGSVPFDMTTGGVGTAASLVESVALTVPLYFDLELVGNAGRVIYGLLEAVGAYAPSASETWKIWLYIENEA